MTAAALCDAPDPTPFEVFEARLGARVILVANYQMTLQDAVDGLQESAVASGLVDLLGQDAVQAIMAKAFARWWGSC